MTLLTLTAGAHYVRSLNMFNAKSGQRIKNFKILRRHIPPLIQTASLSCCQQRSSFNILSVGSGTGEMDMDWYECSEFEICQQTFQEYNESQQRQEDTVKFDMVHFIHGIYQNSEKTQKKNSERTQREGRAGLAHLWPGLHILGYIEAEQSMAWKREDTHIWGAGVLLQGLCYSRRLAKLDGG